jgi:hypothetical protein
LKLSSWVLFRSLFPALSFVPSCLRLLSHSLSTRIYLCFGRI